MLTRLSRLAVCAALSVGVLGWGTAHAGPFILDHTDADDHGFANTTNNFDGWFYMQRVLENLAPGVTNGNNVVVQLGGSSSAAAAAQSAFDKSSLPGAGWSWVNLDGDTALTNFFNGTGATNINNVGIIQLDSGNNVFGGSSFSERAIIDANGVAIDNFLGGGGALHSMAQSYGWLSSLLPGLTFSTSGGSGSLTLTAQGSAAFPGLSNSDLNAGPFHGRWTGGTGGLTTLFTDGTGGDPIGIGSSGGSVTNPDPPSVPLPGTLSLVIAGLLGVIGLRFRRQTA